MEIHLTTLTGKRITIDLDGWDTLDDLKNKIQDKEGLPPSEQRFVYKGVWLEDGGLVLDQIKTIWAKNFPNEPFNSSTFVNLHFVIRLRGGGNQIYHRHDQSSDSDSDSDSEVRRKGPSEHGAFNGGNTIGRKRVASETGIHDLATLDRDGGVEGLLDLSSGNETLSDVRPKEEYKIWRFLSGAGMSVNVLILVVAAAAFLVPKAMTKSFLLYDCLGSSELGSTSMNGDSNVEVLDSRLGHARGLVNELEPVERQLGLAPQQEPSDLSKRLDDIERRVEKLEEKYEKIEAYNEAIKARFHGYEIRLAQLMVAFPAGSQSYQPGPSST